VVPPNECNTWRLEEDSKKGVLKTKKKNGRGWTPEGFRYTTHHRGLKKIRETPISGGRLHVRRAAEKEGENE